MKKIVGLWEAFVQTGEIRAYLNYKEEQRKQGVSHNGKQSDSRYRSKRDDSVGTARG